MSEKGSLRDYIASIIGENPGIHFREIQRKSGAAIGQVEYHTYQLELMGKISIKKDGNLKRYFLVEDTGFNERKVIYFLRKNVSREVIVYLLENAWADPESFLKGRRSKREKVQEAIKEMLEQGIVETHVNNGSNLLYLKDPELMKGVIRRFRESFLDSLSSNVFSLLD